MIEPVSAGNPAFLAGPITWSGSGIARHTLGPIDLLIANAGYAVRREYTEVDLQARDRTLAVNLRAPFLPAQAAVPGRAGRGYGRVLFA